MDKKELLHRISILLENAESEIKLLIENDRPDVIKDVMKKVGEDISNLVKEELNGNQKQAKIPS